MKNGVLTSSQGDDRVHQGSNSAGDASADRASRSGHFGPETYAAASRASSMAEMSSSTVYSPLVIAALLSTRRAARWGFAALRATDLAVACAGFCLALVWHAARE